MSDLELEVVEQHFSLDDVKLGTCMQCGVNQTEKGKQGFWICGMENWACYDCKYGNKGRPAIPSRAFACETCQYACVKWFQGGCYDCPRCHALFGKQGYNF